MCFTQRQPGSSSSATIPCLADDQLRAEHRQSLRLKPFGGGASDSSEPKEWLKRQVRDALLALRALGGVGHSGCPPLHEEIFPVGDVAVGG